MRSGFWQLNQCYLSDYRGFTIQQLPGSQTKTNKSKSAAAINVANGSESA